MNNFDSTYKKNEINSEKNLETYTCLLAVVGGQHIVKGHIFEYLNLDNLKRKGTPQGHIIMYLNLDNLWRTGTPQGYIMVYLNLDNL